uniref:Putative secreted protein n=1 Tax=Ixodes ricinus TaxID=34613 RepID=A0A6B0TX04_IXORI
MSRMLGWRRKATTLSLYAVGTLPPAPATPDAPPAVLAGGRGGGTGPPVAPPALAAASARSSSPALRLRLLARGTTSRLGFR